MNYLIRSRATYHKGNSHYYCLHICRCLISTLRLKECHKLLGVDKNSTPKEIKESFLRLSKVYHPDNKSTGSHMKFVKLKEAYDDIKDAPTASSTTTTASGNPFHRPNEDLRHRTAYSRTQFNDYDAQDFARRYQEYMRRHGGENDTQWDNWHRMRREQTAKQHRDAFKKKYNVSPLASITILLGSVAWILIYSCILLFWEGSDVKSNVAKNRSRRYEEYLAYKEYIRKREAEEAARNTKYEFSNKADVNVASGDN